jgi:hypothetical protein
LRQPNPPRGQGNHSPTLGRRAGDLRPGRRKGHAPLLEFVAVTIDNKNTRNACLHACRRFFAWYDRHEDVEQFADIEPMHVAAYIQRRRAANDRKRRRQNPDDRRLSDARAARSARLGHRQEKARPRHPIDLAVPRAAPRGAVQAEGEGFSTRAERLPRLKVLAARRAAFASGYQWPDQRLPRCRRPWSRGDRRAVLACPQQSHRAARTEIAAAYSRRRMAALWRIERDADGRCADLVLMARVDGMAARMLRQPFQIPLYRPKEGRWRPLRVAAGSVPRQGSPPRSQAWGGAVRIVGADLDARRNRTRPQGCIRAYRQSRPDRGHCRPVVRS